MAATGGLPLTWAGTQAPPPAWALHPRTVSQHPLTKVGEQRKCVRERDRVGVAQRGPLVVGVEGRPREPDWQDFNRPRGQD